MADDSDAILEQLRDELLSTGYGALVREDELANEGRDRAATQALDELLERLQSGVVTAMLAHATSIRNLMPSPGPSGRVWEPLPGRSSVSHGGAETDIAIRLDEDSASRLEEQAQQLDRLISELRGSSADEG